MPSEPALRVRRHRYLALVAALLAAAGVGFASHLQLRAVRTGVIAETAVPFQSLDRRDGLLYRRNSTTPFTGWMLDVREDGGLRSRTHVSFGLLEGVSEGYYSDGALQIREHFSRGIPEGLRTTWSAAGHKVSEGTFVAGKQEGLYRRWHENQTPEIEAAFLNGKPNGISRAWYASGFLKAETLMREGEVLERHDYQDGQQRVPLIPSDPPQVHASR